MDALRFELKSGEIAAAKANKADMEPTDRPPKYNGMMTQPLRAFMAAAPTGASRKKHPGKAVMAGKIQFG